MDKEKVTIVFQIPERDLCTDVEIPLYISANELVVALNEAYSLHMDTSDVKNCFLKAERPVALLKGNKTLAELGVRNGTHIVFG